MTSDDLKTIRASTGMTQVEFSIHLGVDVSTIRSWEQGRISISRLNAAGIRARVKEYLSKSDPQRSENA